MDYINSRMSSAGISINSVSDMTVFVNRVGTGNWNFDDSITIDNKSVVCFRNRKQFETAFLSSTPRKEANQQEACRYF